MIYEMKKLEWNVIYNNVNRSEIGVFNVFNHGGFSKDVQKHLKECRTRDELSEALRRSAMYYFWSKCEWEICISPLHERDDKSRIKVDAYWQIRNNWDLFVDYVWGAKKNTVPKRRENNAD